MAILDGSVEFRLPFYEKELTTASHRMLDVYQAQASHVCGNCGRDVMFGVFASPRHGQTDATAESVSLIAARMLASPRKKSCITAFKNSLAKQKPRSRVALRLDALGTIADSSKL